jgi:hypothetical protein
MKFILLAAAIVLALIALKLTKFALLAGLIALVIFLLIRSGLFGKKW